MDGAMPSVQMIRTDARKSPVTPCDELDTGTIHTLNFFMPMICTGFLARWQCWQAVEPIFAVPKIRTTCHLFVL